ncbi:hypothetical protein M6B38_232990 [Iris pallida]|uniref:Secreted protein n=1 Tax=Iris pallida TaxID=29817 RepID=A0AAX6DQ49_IRIPA|nr:hypothetical protein M6B38_232990 [Iris pallida]
MAMMTTATTMMKTVALVATIEGADDPDDDGFDGGDSGSLAVTRARLLPVSSSSSCLLPRRVWLRLPEGKP